MPVSEKQRKYAEDFQGNFDDIKVRIIKGQREPLKKVAEAAGYSLNQFIVDAINEKLQTINPAELQKISADAKALKQSHK